MKERIKHEYRKRIFCEARVLLASACGRLRDPIRAGAAERYQLKAGQTRQREQKIGGSGQCVASNSS